MTVRQGEFVLSYSPTSMSPERRMENSERPEKRRKLDEVNDPPGSRFNQPRPMTLGERKRNGPRVLLNKLNLNNEIIERLRRVSKLWEKQAAVQKDGNQGNDSCEEINGFKDAENAPVEIGTSGTDNGNELKNGVLKEAKSKELGKDFRQGVSAIPNDRKSIKTNPVDNGKSEVNVDGVLKQAAEDVLSFKQVLKEVIEQRTKIVEEAVAANSIHLQNRIRELERENRELQWSARKLFGAFKKYVAGNEKKNETKTSRGIQVNTETLQNFEKEVPSSRVISPSRDRDILVEKSPVSSIESMASPRVPSMMAVLSSTITNTTLASSMAPQQSSPQLRPNLTSLAQQINSKVSESTAVVFTVTPWPTGPQATQQRNKVPEDERRSLETRTARHGLAVRNTYPQPQPLVHTKSPPSVVSQIQSPSQANPNSDRINKHQVDVTQQRLSLQQQLGSPQTSKSPAQQRLIIPSASLLQQLQRQQQLQQQQNDQQMKNPRQLSTLSAPSPRKPDPSPQQAEQIQQPSVAPDPIAPLSLASAGVRNPNDAHQTAVSYSTSAKQISPSNLSNQRSNLVISNTQVCEHLNRPVNQTCSNPPSLPLLVNTSAHAGKTLERRETSLTVNVSLNGNHQKQPTFTSDHLSRNHTRFDIAHGITATRREVSQFPAEASATNASNYNQFQPDIQSMQKTSFLVRARKKHSEQNNLLPSGYRISLPSPEYLLQQQKFQFQNPSQKPQANQVSQIQPVQSNSLTGRGGQHSQPPQFVYTRQTPAVQSHDDTATQPAGYRPTRRVPENRSPQQYHQDRHFQYSKQPQQAQPPTSHLQPKAAQGKHQETSLTREGISRNVTLQSLYSPPIQSPGISSSDSRKDRHSQDAQRTATANSTSSSLPTNARQVLVDQGVLQKPMPKPSASIAVMGSGIVLSWNMEYDGAEIKIDNYELFACQDITETNEQPIKWKKIGIVKALPLPMACTLTQFSTGSKYFFSVRAVDGNERAGPFSDPCTVSLNS